ncbi:MAG TPA: F0F1 ATP synthase subunit alpha, partial [Thermoguttaceae bacterium]|nr:F0F1 ATP synthase subunit alpha [Thermoguttaceae bacterium]
SVSRVGGHAQIPAMKKVAAGLRLQLAAYRELEASAQLGTELDPATQARLDRGARMVELLKQPQYQPMHVTDQVLSIYAGTRGYLDPIPVEEVAAWEQAMLQYVRANALPLWQRITDARDLPLDAQGRNAELDAVLDQFQQVYLQQKPSGKDTTALV